MFGSCWWSRSARSGGLIAAGVGGGAPRRCSAAGRRFGVRSGAFPAAGLLVAVGLQSGVFGAVRCCRSASSRVSCSRSRILPMPVRLTHRRPVRRSVEPAQVVLAVPPGAAGGAGRRRQPVPLVQPQRADVTPASSAATDIVYTPAAGPARSSRSPLHCHPSSTNSLPPTQRKINLLRGRLATSSASAGAAAPWSSASGVCSQSGGDRGQGPAGVPLGDRVSRWEIGRWCSNGW